jgi:hypothetical protein
MSHVRKFSTRWLLVHGPATAGRRLPKRSTCVRLWEDPRARDCLRRQHPTILRFGLRCSRRKTTLRALLGRSLVWRALQRQSGGLEVFSNRSLTSESRLPGSVTCEMNPRFLFRFGFDSDHFEHECRNLSCSHSSAFVSVPHVPDRTKRFCTRVLRPHADACGDSIEEAVVPCRWPPSAVR